MLQPFLSERMALEIRNRIIKWLQNYYANNKANQSYGRLAQIKDFADSGEFDDISESSFLRVLKDMKKFGTVTFSNEYSNQEEKICVQLNERLRPSGPCDSAKGVPNESL